MKLITVAEAAKRLGVHRSRVNVLIKEGRLPAVRYGRAYLIEEKNLALVKDRRPGRPSSRGSAGAKNAGHGKGQRSFKR